MSKVNEIVERWKSGEKQIDIANNLEVTESYVSKVLRPFKNGNDPNPIIYTSNMPEGVRIAWSQVSESIESAWGEIKEKKKDENQDNSKNQDNLKERKKEPKIKWPSKYGHYLILKGWIEKQF